MTQTIAIWLPIWDRVRAGRRRSVGAVCLTSKDAAAVSADTSAS